MGGTAITDRHLLHITKMGGTVITDRHLLHITKMGGTGITDRHLLHIAKMGGQTDTCCASSLGRLGTSGRTWA